MLNELLTLTRPLFVLDTETTGTDPRTDRIVEIGFQRWDATGMTKEWRALVNPGIPIPPEATKIHHITDEMVVNAPPFKRLAPNLAVGFAKCDYGGQQIRFDLKIVAAEMARSGQLWNYVGARIIDSFRLEAVAIPRDLSTLYEKYTGQKHDGAHGALSDVKASTAVIVGQLTTHEVLSRDIDELHKVQWPDYIDCDGFFRRIGGVAMVMFGKWRGKPMRSVDPDYWNWVSGQKAGFTDEIKQIARGAMIGKFPDD